MRRQPWEKPGEKREVGRRQHWKNHVRPLHVGLGKEFGFYSGQEIFYRVAI